MVRVEFIVCPGSQPMRLQNIETDDGLVDMTKLGMKNSVINFKDPQSFAMHCNPQLFSQVCKRLICVYLVVDEWLCTAPGPATTK
jgi:hypothetical protein